MTELNVHSKYIDKRINDITTKKYFTYIKIYENYVKEQKLKHNGNN